MSKRPDDLGYGAGWCIHYRYNRGLKPSQPNTCEAGVDYDQFRAENFNMKFAQQPCFLTETGESKPDALPCPHLRRPTPEEIALHEEWMEERINRMRVVMAAIRPWREKHKGQSFQEVVECPLCKGGLHLSISGYNSHIHGHCNTVNCVSWME